jgi:hypothetical protein
MTTGRKKGRGEPMPASEALRQAILGSGESLYRVSKGSGVPYATLHRFVKGGVRQVSLDSFDRLCAYLGLRLTR